jgi:hypothetical protein
MTNPGFPPGFIDPVLEPADIEWLGLYYLTHLTPDFGSTPIGTRLPNPADNADTINGFLRLEAGGGSAANAFEYNQSLILHSYSPNEIQASWICRTAFKWAKAARGQSVAGWYVSAVTGCVMPHRLSDPNVIGLIRYRAMVTWRVPGLVGGS